MDSFEQDENVFNSLEELSSPEEDKMEEVKLESNENLQASSDQLGSNKHRDNIHGEVDS